MVFSVFDYRATAVSAAFKASESVWYNAGLLSVQRDGAISVFLCAARENCKSSRVMVGARRVACREDRSCGSICRSPVSNIHAIHSLFV